MSGPTKTSNWLFKSNDMKAGCVVGEYPKEEDVKKLLALGFNVFINLCEKSEISARYDYEKMLGDEIEYLRFPMKRKKIPDPKTLYPEVHYVFKLLLEGKLIYIHSVNGSGRTSVYCNSMMMLIDKKSSDKEPSDVIKKSYSTREIKTLPGPFETIEQSKFYIKFGRSIEYEPEPIKEPPKEEIPEVKVDRRELRKRRVMEEEESHKENPS